MALNWQWTDKIGYYENENGIVYNLYGGNALMIACREWTADGEELYNVVWFWCDKDHAKNMLGIGKDSEEVMQHLGIKRFTLFRANPKTKDIINLILRSGWEVDIDVR